MMDLESASALVRTFYTVPLLVTVVVVGAVLVRRRLARRRRAALSVQARPEPTDRAQWAPRTQADAVGPHGRPGASSACARRGHDLVVDHHPRTGVPLRVRCADPACGASWDPVAGPVADPTGRPAAATQLRPSGPSLPGAPHW
jgi:hypothetical protein